MSQNNITLKELAKILDVSISTISKALNDSHEISEATKTKIKELAKLHNYQPNKLAINLKSGKTKTIAVLIPSIQNYFFAKVLLGIESVVAKSPYNIIIGITNESYEDEKENLQKLSNGIVDGFILSVAEETQIKQEFNHFKNTSKPIVMFDRVIKTIESDKVLEDNTINKLEVETGIRNDGNLELISGLSQGDKIVAEGLSKVRPGGKIKPIIKTD